MSKILFLNQPSMGHLNTLLTIALQMREDGHEIKFLLPGIENFDFNFQIFKTAQSVLHKLKINNIPFDTLKPTLSQLFYGLLLPYSQGYKEMQVALNLFLSGIEQLTREGVEKARAFNPDILVSDFGFIAGYCISEILEVPCAVIYHSGLPFKGDNVPPFGSGLPISENYSQTKLGKQLILMEEKTLQKLDKNLNSVRKKFNLSLMASQVLRTPYSKWLNLITSHGGIEAPRNNLTDNTFFIGTCFAKTKVQPDSNFPFDQLQKNKYKIYVSLGTVFNNKPRVFKKIIAGLNISEFQVIVSAGGAYETLIRNPVPDNTMIFKTVPQVDLLPLVDLVIGHGGNNSTNETLSAGKPLIILPVGGEQGDNASRVEYLQAGIRGDINNFTENEILHKVKQIKNNRLFREKALFYKSILEQTDGPVAASKLISWVTEHKKPLQRTVDLPLTVTRENIEKLLGAYSP